MLQRPAEEDLRSGFAGALCKRDNSRVLKSRRRKKKVVKKKKSFASALCESDKSRVLRVHTSIKRVEGLGLGFRV